MTRRERTDSGGPVGAERTTRLLLGILLAAIVLAAFWPVLGNGFTSYDDNLYVTRNPHVQTGPTPTSLRWALTATRAGNWHPLTWVSHMLDWQLFGADPRGHHLVSLLLHLANTLLLFFVLDLMTGAAGRSAFAAALFGVHPLHVESVAWVAERKDLLSTLFWLLSIWAYARYARSKHLGSYLLVVAAFAAGLSSKPMIVTLPFTLLLLDAWPLGRIPVLDGRSPFRSRFPWRLLTEKLPLFVLSAASCIVTYEVQRGGGNVVSAEQIPFAERAVNAAVSAATYLRTAVWPTRLAVFYPHPRASLPPWKVIAAAAFLATVTAIAVRIRSRRPFVLSGWLWFLGTLTPVIGLVQVGGQARADRYTYVPLIGIFVIVAWGVADLVGPAAPRSGRRRLLVGSAVSTILVLAACTRVQAGTWRDSRALFEHAVAVTSDNYKALTSLGIALAADGKRDEAVARYTEALRVNPEYAPAHVDLAIVLASEGRLDEAIQHYDRVLRLDPGNHEAHVNLANALVKQGKFDEAFAHYAEALHGDPEDPRTHVHWGAALASRDRWSEAAEHFSAATRLDPGYARAHSNLAAALFYLGRYAEATAEIEQARRLGFEPPADLVRLLAEKTGGPGKP